MPAAVCAAGAIVHYLKTELRRSLAHLTRLQVYRNSQFMILDAVTQANLELVHARGGGRDTSLLGALDRTVTPMGARKLRDWILHPLCHLAAINARQQFIGELLAQPFLLAQLRETAKSIRDLERTVGRLTQTGGNARDLQVLRTGLEQIPALKHDLAALQSANPHIVFATDPSSSFSSSSSSSPAAKKDEDAGKEITPSLTSSLQSGLHELPHLVDLLTRAVVEEPPALTKEGGIFRDGYFAALDELRAAAREGKDWIAQLQQRAIDETGIKSLKVRYTSVFGYFIEVTKSNLDKVPPTWHRKQTVATGERFITPS